MTKSKKTTKKAALKKAHAILAHAKNAPIAAERPSKSQKAATLSRLAHSKSRGRHWQAKRDSQ